MSATSAVSAPVAARDFGHRHLLVDQPLEDAVEQCVGRQAVLVLLVGAKLGARRLGDHASGITGPSGPSAPSGRCALRQRDSANTVVL